MSDSVLPVGEIKRCREELAWECPHCEHEIGEKELRSDGANYIHSCCGGKIQLPPPTKAEQEWIKALDQGFSVTIKV